MFNRLLGDWRKKNNAETYYIRGEKLAKKGLIKEAEAEFLKSIELDHDYYRSYSYLGSIYLSQRKFEEAITNYEKALKINPNDSITNFALGIQYYRISQDDLAYEYLANAIVAEPSIEMKVYNEIRNIGYAHDFEEIVNLVNLKLLRLYLKNEKAEAHESLDSVENASSEKSLEGEVYTNREFGFSIMYPPGSKISNKPEPGIVIRFLDIKKKYSINIIAGPTDGILESFRDLEHKALMAIHLNKYKLISLRRIKIGDIESVEVIYEHPQYIKSKKVGFVKNGVEFVITCGVRIEKFEELEPLLNKCIQSFKFNK
jgi:tetratricopeptide (TPR) repeat protein